MLNPTAPTAPQGPLTYRLHIPEGAHSGSPLLVLLHGRGADETDLLGLAPLLPKDMILVSPRGPFPGEPWGYGPGWAWYRYLAEDRVDNEALDHSMSLIDELVVQLGRELPLRTGSLIMGGFSQGGTTSLAWALTRPGRLVGVVNFSGFLVDSPLVAVETVDLSTVPSVFWGHGLKDASIPFELGERGRERLRRAGIGVESFDHPGGHTITAEELHGFQQWLQTLEGEGA